MANLTETASWEATVNEIATTDPVVGGVGGPANVQATQLANRTAYLKALVDDLAAAESMASHLVAPDPHPQYLMPAEADAAYKPLSAIDVPVSMVLASASASIPAGFLECNGASLLRASYADLFALIGTIYGAADASHFNLPDLRGEFIRGLDNGRGVDIGRGLGSFQMSTQIHHMANTGGNVVSTNSDDTNSISRAKYENVNTASYTKSDTFTRPRNISMIYIIKY